MKSTQLPEFSQSEIILSLINNYNLSGELKKLSSYRDQNLLLTTTKNQQYIVKIANSVEPLLELEMQNAAMAHLTKKKIAVPQVIANQRGDLISLITDAEQQQYFLRLLTFLPGQFYGDLNKQNHNPVLWSNLGEFMGELDMALADFQHPAAFRYLQWDLAQGYRECQTKKHLLTTQQVALVDYYLALYQTQTLPLLSQLPQAVIHNDANDFNLLINDLSKPEKIIGLIDFGDIVHSQVINELAICCAYALMGQDEPLNTLKIIVAGYHKTKPLEDLELEVLYSLIALRLCTTVCNSALALQQEPDNDYLSVSVKPAWVLLKQLRSHNPYGVLCQLRLACRLAVDTGQSNESIILYRQKHLGKTLSLSYQEPLKIVRGQGTYLYDEKGNAYLDMVNNVCHVGHCHPKVVAAGQAQLAKLNTNTRFLHDNIVLYTEKLLATLPEQLSVCMFVNSGSEANELALRLARSYTKTKELIVVDGAYHGNTNACIEASPYKFNGPGGEGAQPYVHTVALPDPYRGKGYTNSVRDVIAGLAQQGKQPGAFICESLQGVAGQIIMPDGYLTSAYASVRAAGGVCIADEVQVGFGRVGTHMWAFETQNVVPDILTLGKPIANGHPMAAVITTQAIADAFVNGMEYFNTFGGNPVSCAIGLAVLEVIEEDKLRENALSTGLYFRQKLMQLQQQFNLIGDVRGLGLFIGVEMVEDRLSKQPATEKTAWLVEFFKQQGILLSTEGPFYNIFKIKPPLTFNTDDADKFIKVLQLGLTKLELQ